VQSLIVENTLEKFQIVLSRSCSDDFGDSIVVVRVSKSCYPKDKYTRRTGLIISEARS
jgi:hypothetical protein